MVRILPFKAVRPKPEYVLEMSAPPYDVIDSYEAKKLAADKDKSYLRITRPEVDFLSDIDEHSDIVYQKGRDNYLLFKNNAWLIQEFQPCYYIYKQVMGWHSQIGVVAVAAVDDYDNDVIKKHEYTRPDKEDDRTKHIYKVRANTEAVFFTYRAQVAIDSLVNSIVNSQVPEYDFVSEDGVRHTLWICRDQNKSDNLKDYFAQIAHVYVADGHHRSAAASRVCKILKDQNAAHTGLEEYNFFLTVLFPDNQMNIMPYNRVIKDLNGLSQDEFLNLISDKFHIKPAGNDTPESNIKFCMYLAKNWYQLEAKPNSYNAEDPVKSLDASILQNNLLSPILGIKDPRLDKRINFVGGIRGTSELVKLVDSNNYAVAFSLYPVTISQLVNVADSKQVMPPKSTWFEPKLRSGLFVHELE